MLQWLQQQAWLMVGYFDLRSDVRCPPILLRAAILLLVAVGVGAWFVLWLYN